MSENSNQLVNTQASDEPAPTPNGVPAKPQDGMREVDQGTQEKAAEEREKSGGYD